MKLHAFQDIFGGGSDVRQEIAKAWEIYSLERSHSISGLSPIPHLHHSVTMMGGICVTEGRAYQGWPHLEIEVPVSSRKHWC